MQVKQIAEIMNEITNEILGKEQLVAEDLSNIVDVGKELLDATDVDNYVKTLQNHIGKVIFVDRVYEGSTPSVLMDAWEFGSMLEKVREVGLPEAVDNPAWKLENGQDYADFKFYQPVVSAKFYNGKDAMEIKRSYTEMQVKESFSSPDQLYRFISMLENNVRTGMIVRQNALIKRLLNKAIADTIYDDYSTAGGPMGDLTASSGIKAVNLLYLYNEKMASLDENWVNLTPALAIRDPGFIRDAAYLIGLYADRMAEIYTGFNVGHCERFTPAEDRHTILLSEFRRAADVYLQSDTYHEEYTKLTNSEVVPYWQAPGEDYSFENTSKIIYKTGENSSLTFPGVLGIMFDRYALGVANLNKRVKTQVVPDGEFYTNFYKFDAGYFLDTNENIVVFFVA